MAKELPQAATLGLVFIAAYQVCRTTSTDTTDVVLKVEGRGKDAGSWFCSLQWQLPLPLPKHFCSCVPV